MRSRAADTPEITDLIVAYDYETREPVLVIGGALHASLVAPAAAPAAVSGAILVLLAGWVLDRRQPSDTRV